MLSVRSLVVSFAALAFFALPASAATFNGFASLTEQTPPFTNFGYTPSGVNLSGTVDNPVSQNSIYEAFAQRNDAESFTDTVNFNFNPVLGSQLSVTNIIISSRGFSSLIAEWIGPSSAVPIVTYNVVVPGAGSQNLVLPLTQGNGLYKLELIGTSNAAGGSYLADVATGFPTPLPAAAYLFGSVLAGAAGFGIRRRRKQTV
jgi:hypothetical protein